MLTRLQVEGFKNLLDVDLRLGPFTCIAGLNGAGKSNIFDAIRLLHLLARFPIMEAVQMLRESRGRSLEPRSLFTAFGDFRAPLIRLTADLIVDRKAVDDFGVEVEASISTLRYSVAFRLDESSRRERLELVAEELAPISLKEARKKIGFEASKQFLNSTVTGRRTKPLISTLREAGSHQIRVHQEGHGGRLLPAPKSSRTVLNGVASSDFPTLLAVQREMESWQTLLLEPSAMRSPSFFSDPRQVDSRGANMPAAIERLRKRESKVGQTYSRIENRLSELIDDVQEVRVLLDDPSETLTLEVKGADDVFHPARSLSDGTLRFLVLTTLAIDPEGRGVVCLEEPENGIHPQRVAAMVELLRDMACDPEFAVEDSNPLRQVVINTHSPKVIDQLELRDVVFVEGTKVWRSSSKGEVAAVLVPQNSWRTQFSSTRVLTPSHMHPYFSFGGRILGQLGMPFSS